MTPEQFTYWLQGFVELNHGQSPTAEQWQSIQDHLKTVFKKITPVINDRYCHYTEADIKINFDEILKSC